MSPVSLFKARDVEVWLFWSTGFCTVLMQPPLSIRLLLPPASLLPSQSCLAPPVQVLELLIIVNLPFSELPSVSFLSTPFFLCGLHNFFWNSSLRLKTYSGLPWWSSGKEFTCQWRGHGFDPWSRNIPLTMGQLSPCTTAEACAPSCPCPTTREATPVKSLCTTARE